MASIYDHIATARRRLEQAGIQPSEAAVDAELLARHALGGWDRGHLVAEGREPAAAEFPGRFTALIERRERREPAAYIVGSREFWGLDFDVSPAVLVPRPETELMIEEVLARVSSAAAVGSQPVAIADIGTGSGCLAVTLAREIPSARVLATDVSRASLDVARRNASRHGVSARVTFTEGDLFANQPGPFNIIVSNPPYVPAATAADIQPEVRDFEPHGALFAGTDGLDLVRRLVPEAAARLAVGGWFLFEFGFGQATAVAEIIRREERLVLVGLREDLAGIPRVAIARSERHQ